MNIRKLQIDDLKKGYLQLLEVLTVVGEADFDKRFREMEKLDPYLQIWIAEEGNTIIGSATLFIEPKFIHSCSQVGHIEDVVVAREYQGKGVGRLLIETLKQVGKEAGCYKMILDCSEKNKVFYEKCGYENKNIQMSLYL